MLRTCGGNSLRLFLCIIFTAQVGASIFAASTVVLAPIVVTTKKDVSLPKWQFIEALNTDYTLSSGFEEQQLKNIPGVTTTTSGNPGQLTTISIQGAGSKYTKVLWAGLSISEKETDAALMPFSTGKVEVIKGIHCAEYGNGAIGGVVNVIPFSMPDNQGGGIKLSAGNYAQSGHVWWRKKTDGFSLQQHIESDSFQGKNSIPKRYQDKYPTLKKPKTQKQYFLNQLGFESHHVKTVLQVGLVKAGTTGSNIKLVSPYDARSKRTLQIYALELEGAPETIQPYFKTLYTKVHAQDFSPYQTNSIPYSFENTKAKVGIKFKYDALIFEPVIEHHHSAAHSSGSVHKQNDEYAFAQGIHLSKSTLTWKNWVRIHKANHFKQMHALSSSVLTRYADTEFSAHLGTGFRLPDLYMLNDKKYGNTNLKNETAYGGNLGVAQKTHLGTFSMLVFRTEYKHQITYRNNRYENLNKASQKGFELGWKNKVGAFGTELSCMYTESVSLKPKKALMNIPKVTANGRVFYEKEDVSSSLGWRYTGNQMQPDFEQSTLGTKRGGYPVFFGDFQYKFKEQATWFMGVENALARHIESPHGYRSPGFQINTGVSITW
jgi:outer membrane cobalamin receptor